MTTNPQPTPPAGDEILSPEVAKMKLEGMKYAYKVSEVKEWRSFPSQWKIIEDDFNLYDFSAPLGTTALLLTPGPEVGECECDTYVGAKIGEHFTNCPVHPNNAYVKVLPGWLAGLKEKPEGLLFTSAIMEWKWTKDTEIWEKVLAKQLTRHYAYAVPRHVFDALSRPDPIHNEVAKMDESKLQGEQVPADGPNPSPGAADWCPLFKMDDGCEVSMFADGTLSWNEGSGPFLIFNKDETERFFTWIDNRPYRTPPPVAGSGPTDTEMLDWLEEKYQPGHNFTKLGFWFLQRALGRNTDPLRAVIQQAMQPK